MTRARAWTGAAGQTTTEYLMIAGLMAAVIVSVFVFYWQSTRPSALEWVNRVRCAIAGSMLNNACGVGPGDSPPPPSATASGPPAAPAAGGPATPAAVTPPAADPPSAGTPPPPPEFKFESPMIDGVALGGGGQAAADMYCRRMGYGRAAGYVEFGIAGASKNIVTGETCSGYTYNCPGFYTITCTP